MAAAPVTADQSSTESAGKSRFLRRLPGRATWLRLAAALAGGGVLYASFPPRPLWWLAPIGVAGLAAAVHGRRARAGFGYGLVFGMAYLAPVLLWLYDFLGSGFGPWPWLGLSLVEALFLALAAAGMAVVSRTRGAPIWMAALFIGGEALRSRLPINGFPWAKVGFSQPGGWYLPLAALGGSPLVGFAVVVSGCGLAALVRALVVRRIAGRNTTAAARVARPGWRVVTGAALAVVLPLLAGVAAMPLIGTDPNAGSVTVAVVQGNAPNAGLGLLNDMALVRRNQLAEADQLAAEIHSGQVRKPDLVIWPETGVDIGRGHEDPAVITAVSRELGVPMAVGALYYNPDGTVQNAMLKWLPGNGPTQEYAKQELVPFSEYIPYRPLARLVTPFVDYFGDMTAGHTPDVFQLGQAKVGFSICYEVAYDWVSNAAVRAGATLLSVPTNNAWFGRTDMSYQQLAMSRLRAVEHGRAVVVSATSGVSAFVQPDGTVTQQTALFTRDVLVATVPLRSTTTLATWLGTIPEWTLTAVGAAAVAAAVIRRRRRTQRSVAAGDLAEPPRP